MRRHRDERGAEVVEFALVIPLVVAVIGMALFTAYIYEVRSDLQRVAQSAAQYGANQCDPIGRQPVGGCADTNRHPSVAAMRDFAQANFRGVDFSTNCTESDPVMCVVYSDPFNNSTMTTPTANGQVEVTLTYVEDTPFKPLFQLFNLNGLYKLRGHGRATIE